MEMFSLINLLIIVVFYFYFGTLKTFIISYIILLHCKKKT